MVQMAERIWVMLKGLFKNVMRVSAVRDIQLFHLFPLCLFQHNFELFYGVSQAREVWCNQ